MKEKSELIDYKGHTTIANFKLCKEIYTQYEK